MRYFIFTFCILFINISYVIPQGRNYPLINFTTKDYGREFHPSNLAVAQDHRGVIYIANGFKLLEFDGHTWNSYPINKETWILSIAIDKSGIIYTGSQHEFGYFAPDNSGELKYTSLSDSLDQSLGSFTNIWKVHILPDGIIFQAEEMLFIYRNGNTEVIKPETSFHTSFTVRDTLYVRERGIGLVKYNERRLVKIEGSEIFDTTGIFIMLPYGRNSKKNLIGTRDKGFWIYDSGNSSNHFQKAKLKDDPIIEKAKISYGSITSDGSFAIGTMLDGLILMDSTGTIRSRVNKESGLSDNDVKCLITDHDGNLWLALNNGISTVEISSPLSYYTEKSGLTGSINAVIRYNGLLYAGTSTGLFVNNPKQKSGVQFEPAFNLMYPVRDLIESDGCMIAGTDAGLFSISASGIQKIGSEESFALFYSPTLRMLFSGGPRGLVVFKKHRSFVRAKLTHDIKTDIIGITGINYETGDSSEIWIGTRYEGAIRMKLKNGFSYTDHFNSSDGIPEGPVSPYWFNNKLVFGTINGLFSFINESEVQKALPDSLRNNKEFLRGYFSPFSLPDDSKDASVSYISENADKVWICFDNMIGYYDINLNMTYINQPFLGIDVGKINILYPEGNEICWFGTTDGLIRYDGSLSREAGHRYFNLIRKVTLPGTDSILFRGTYLRKDNSGAIFIEIDQPSSYIPSLLYVNNSLRIDFGATFYEYRDKLDYSYLLDGENSKWSAWSPANYQEYTNLREGSYTFRVKARNVYGEESNETLYSFIILPPWYRSSIAYFCYLILLIIIIWAVARLYSYRLKRENIRLEGIVTERTAEVVRQKNEIENKNTILEYQKKEIEDSIRYARRIQSAVIPSEKDCLELLPESFVFFRPLNIVSGDFYWISKVGTRIIYTAADCTGHGVPGAFMSMLGVAFLNEIVNKDNITEPDKILNNLRNKVIQALQQQGLSGEARDGMDIAIISLDIMEKKLYFAGAYNSLMMVRNGEIVETDGDNMPIGIYEKMNPFTCHEVDVQQGDAFYMCSDGYEDQFGGPDGKKFKSRRFRQMLVEINAYPMKTQKEIIEKRLDEWKGELNQIDDVVVTGLKIT